MKKKIFAIALAVLLFALAIAGSSMAYFTDTKEYTNTFTSGNVTISLTEAVTVKDATGNIVVDTTASGRVDFNANDVYNPLFPTQKIAKDPTITNVGTESAYVGATIDITNATGTVDAALTAATVNGFITGLPTTPDATVTVTEINEGGEVIGFRVYVVFTNALAKNGTATIFTGMEIPADWNNDAMKNIDGLKLDVKAYAVQSAGMTNGALAALQTAFDAFDSLS